MTLPTEQEVRRIALSSLIEIAQDYNSRDRFGAALALLNYVGVEQEPDESIPID